MNKVVLLAMLCVAPVSCVELENLCSSDTFENKDVLVNAFNRVKLNLTFQSLNHYLINDTVVCDRPEFNNTANLDEALKLKSEL